MIRDKSGAIDTRFIAAWRFFRENAGYSTPPGRVACAMEYARAERDGRALGWSVVWADDDGCTCHEFDFICDCQRVDRRGRSECHCEYAALWDDRGNFMDSLSGICGADADYRRVVAAELMLEALAARWAEAARWDAYLGRIVGVGSVSPIV